MPVIVRDLLNIINEDYDKKKSIARKIFPDHSSIRALKNYLSGLEEEKILTPEEQLDVIKIFLTHSVKREPSNISWQVFVKIIRIFLDRNINALELIDIFTMLYQVNMLTPSVYVQIQHILQQDNLENFIYITALLSKSSFLSETCLWEALLAHQNFPVLFSALRILKKSNALTLENVMSVIESDMPLKRANIIHALKKTKEIAKRYSKYGDYLDMYSGRWPDELTCAFLKLHYHNISLDHVVLLTHYNKPMLLSESFGILHQLNLLTEEFKVLFFHHPNLENLNFILQRLPVIDGKVDPTIVAKLIRVLAGLSSLNSPAIRRWYFLFDDYSCAPLALKKQIWEQLLSLCEDSSCSPEQLQSQVMDYLNMLSFWHCRGDPSSVSHWRRYGSDVAFPIAILPACEAKTSQVDGLPLRVYINCLSSGIDVERFDRVIDFIHFFESLSPEQLRHCMSSTYNISTNISTLVEKLTQELTDASQVSAYIDQYLYLKVMIEPICLCPIDGYERGHFFDKVKYILEEKQKNSEIKSAELARAALVTQKDHHSFSLPYAVLKRVSEYNSSLFCSSGNPRDKRMNESMRVYTESSSDQRCSC